MLPCERGTGTTISLKLNSKIVTALPNLTSMSRLQEQLHLHGLEMTDDGSVRWKQDSVQHPRNWSWQWKVYNAALVTFLDFFM